MKNLAGWLFALCLLLPHSRTLAGDDTAAPEVSEHETTVVCFLPDGAAPPADYLTGKMPGYDAIEKAFTLKYKKTGLLDKFMSIEVSFLEPAGTTQVISDRKGKLDWLRPETVKNPESQYGFSLEVRSDKKKCVIDDALPFIVQVQAGGKVTQAPNPVFLWKYDKPKTQGALPDPRTKVITAGFGVSFNSRSTFYKNEAVLYTGVPFSKSVEKLILTATDCFGKEHRFIYNFKYNSFP